MRGRGPSFREVLRVREFRALWGAELLSILGDQLARVALALLVYQRTASAALTALTYALTFAPAVIGGALLSGLADRFPRRRVLVATDLLRAGLAAAMAIPGIALSAMWVLVAALSMASAPFKAAQQALLPQVLREDHYLTGLSVRQVSTQGAQLVGYATGGLLLAAIEPHIALAANALTFLASAALIVVGVRPRPAPSVGSASTAVDGAAPEVHGSRQLLPIVALICLVGLFIVPGGVAAPYGAAIGAGSIGVGLLMAADPLGSVIGAWLLPRCGIRPSPKAVLVLAAASGIPLVGCVSGPGLTVSVALCAASGALSTAYLILTQAIVVQLVPDHRRGRVMGQIAASLYSAQGLAILAGGLAAEAVGPFRAVAGAGLLGTMLVLCVGAWWRRVARPRRDLAAGSEHSSDVGRWFHHSFSMKSTSSERDRGDGGHESGAHHSFSIKSTSFQDQADTDQEPGAHHSFSMKNTSFQDQADTDQEPGAHHSFSIKSTSFQGDERDHAATGSRPNESDRPRNRGYEDLSATIMGVSTRDNRRSSCRGEDGSR